jgi:CheY-like chemotaxis protein
VSASPIRVLIVDDQALMREGLKTLLEGEERVEISGEAADGVEALRKIRDAKPDVALVDVRMPRMDGVELTGRLSADHPEVTVIILTTFDDDEYIFGGIRAGARGWDEAPERALRPLYINRGVHRPSLPLLIPLPSASATLSFHGGGTPRSLQTFRASLSGISV